jgi:hypothetical protein
MHEFTNQRIADAFEYLEHAAVEADGDGFYYFAEGAQAAADGLVEIDRELARVKQELKEANVQIKRMRSAIMDELVREAAAEMDPHG